MRVRLFTIYEVEVELHTLDATAFRVVIDGDEICLVHRLPEKKKWRCPCGRCEVREAQALLTHVVTNHANVTYRESWRAPQADVSKGERSFEEMTTYLRLAGKHSDPTYDQAVIYLQH